MRIFKVQLAGLAAAMVGVGGADEARANDVSISTATTNPLQTSAPDGASPGNVTVTSTGSIAVTAGQTAVTVNSNNIVSNAGTLSSNDANNTTGIALQGGFAGPQVITNSGTISLLESYTLTDTDNDGDRDGTFATGTNRHGIRLGAGPAFNGDIVNSGTISVEGNASAGIRLDALLNGDLTSSGAINVTGDNATAIAILGGGSAGVTGDVLARGGAVVTGTASRGLAVEAPIAGQLRINGAWNVTGYHSTTRPQNTANLDADDLQQSGSAIDIRSSVAGGVTIEGIGVEDDLDDDGDGILDNAATNPDTNDDVTASINVFGSAPAINIQADPSGPLVLGATPAAGGWGLHVRGAVNALGVFDNVDATAIRIIGAGPGAGVTTAGGVALDGDVSAGSIEGDAYGIQFGANASAPVLQVRRRLSATVVADQDQTAYGVNIAAVASVPALNNSGTINAQLFGETGDAVAIFDQSNTLATITNSGSITAAVSATDADLSDNIPPPPVTGAAIAIDVSASTIGVTLNQVADTPFNDDDTVDNDSAQRPAVQIVGDVRFGAGADTVNLSAGLIDGALSFGAGADVLNINGTGARYAGILNDSDGQLIVNVTNGTLALEGNTVNISSATFGASSVLSVQLSATPAQSTHIIASGAVTFAPGASVVPVAPVGLPVSGSHTFLTANGGLVGGANVERVFSGTGSPWLYNFEVDAIGNTLVANYNLKTAAQLALDANQAIAFQPLIDALRPNAAAAAALASLDTQVEFFDAYEDLMPSFASASAELAATGIQQAQSAASNRLAATRLQGVDETSVWAQEIGYQVTRTPLTAAGQEYTGAGFGLALGIDAPLNNGALFGVSASLLASEATEEGRPDGEISSFFGQANAYLGTALGPIDLDLIAGLGGGQMRSRRFVEIGPDFRAAPEAEWWAYEGHAALRAAAPMRLAEWFIVTPQAAVTYVHMTEQGYTETGGGAGIDYDADEATSQRAWGDAGLELSGRWRLGPNSIVAPRLYGGYRSNLINDAAERTFRFATGGPAFTLTDEISEDGAPLVGLGVDASNGYSTISLSYEGELGDQIERHSLNAAVRFRF
jgi:uncharacterized protein with beta-barrel porin domain